MGLGDIDDLETFLETMAPTHDDIQHEMAERAADEGFPIIGPAAGAVLRQFARASDARRIFEFGSGYGYSATWFAPTLPDDGQLVLTEIDPEELELARSYLERAGYDDRIAYEAGDALDAIEGYDGPFDVVLIDIAKHQYVDAFEAVRGEVPPGGVVIADNALFAGSMDTQGIVDAVIDHDDDPDLDEMGDGIRRYLQHVGADPAFTTSVLPVGSGLAVSVRE